MTDPMTDPMDDVVQVVTVVDSADAAHALVRDAVAARRAGELEAFLTDQHPYDVPEVLTTPVTGGNPAYLAWVAREVR